MEGQQGIDILSLYQFFYLFNIKLNIFPIKYYKHKNPPSLYLWEWIWNQKLVPVLVFQVFGEYIFQSDFFLSDLLLILALISD